MGEQRSGRAVRSADIRSSALRQYELQFHSRSRSCPPCLRPRKSHVTFATDAVFARMALRQQVQLRQAGPTTGQA